MPRWILNLCLALSWATVGLAQDPAALAPAAPKAPVAKLEW